MGFVWFEYVCDHDVREVPVSRWRDGASVLRARVIDQNAPMNERTDKRTDASDRHSSSVVDIINHDAASGGGDGACDGACDVEDGDDVVVGDVVVDDVVVARAVDGDGGGDARGRRDGDARGRRRGDGGEGDDDAETTSSDGGDAERVEEDQRIVASEE